LSWSEFGKTEFLGDVFPEYFHGHVTFNFVGFAANKIAEETRPFLKYDNRGYIGHFALKSWMISLVVDSIGVHCTLSGGLYQLSIIRVAVGTDY